MAFNWIKVEKTTARKPEILELAEILTIHPDHAFGLCLRFWMWCDDQLVSSHAPRVTKNAVNVIVQHEGFAEALVKVGWLRVREGSLEVPNFDRHLSQGAKVRALAADRKANQRVQNCHAPRVTKAGPDKNRIDKNREYKEPPNPLPGGTDSEGGASEVSTARDKPAARSAFDPATVPLPETLAASPRFSEAWREFLQHRAELPKSKAKPLTPTAVKTLLTRLERDGPDKAAANLEYSVSMGWVGVYDHDHDSKGKPDGRTRNGPSREAVEYDPDRPDFRPGF